jgi:hypothetical protein
MVAINSISWAAYYALQREDEGAIQNLFVV